MPPRSPRLTSTHWKPSSARGSTRCGLGPRLQRRVQRGGRSGACPAGPSQAGARLVPLRRRLARTPPGPDASLEPAARPRGVLGEHRRLRPGPLGLSRAPRRLRSRELGGVRTSALGGTGRVRAGPSVAEPVVTQHDARPSGQPTGFDEGENGQLTAQVGRAGERRLVSPRLRRRSCDWPRCKRALARTTGCARRSHGRRRRAGTGA